MLKKLIHFTASLKANKTLPWVNEMDAMTDITAIEFTTKQLATNCHDALFNDHQYLGAFLSLDEKTHLIIDNLTQDYLITDHIDLDYQAHIANVAFLYHRQIYQVYLKLIQFSIAIPNEQLLILLARATNSMTEMLKWRFYQFESAPANIWLQLSGLYTIAEEKNLQHEPVLIYPLAELATSATELKGKNNQTTTIEQAYIKACMLGTLETVSFKAHQIDLASKILSMWSSKLMIEKTYDTEKHHFYIDLKQNAAGKRIRNLKVKPQQRYWALDGINSKIELCLSLLEFNIKPKQAKVIAITTSQQALSTLQVLRSLWCKLDLASQRRGANRVSTAKVATICYGFDNACDLIKQVDNTLIQHKNNTQKSTKQNIQLNETLIKETNIHAVMSIDSHSNIVDESHKGMGLHINKQTSDVSIGMLVGIKANDKTYDHKIGIVRNIKPAVGNQLHIGVELLSRTAFATVTENLSSQYENTATANDFGDTVVDFNQDFTRFTSLFLPKEFSNTKEDSFIFPRYQFRKTHTYRVNILGKLISIKPTETLEQHENWVRISYTQVQTN